MHSIADNCEMLVRYVKEDKKIAFTKGYFLSPLHIGQNSLFRGMLVRIGEGETNRLCDDGAAPPAGMRIGARRTGSSVEGASIHHRLPTRCMAKTPGSSSRALICLYL
jgi:hypothetical protein